MRMWVLTGMLAGTATMMWAMLAGHAAIAAPAPAATDPAPAGMVTAADPVSIVTALQASGYHGVVKVNKSGHTFVESAANGSTFAIDLYNCDDNDKRIGNKTLLFSTWWKPAPHLTAALANRYNSNAKFGRAYLNERAELVLELPVTTVGGINQANFGDVVDRWGSADADLNKAVDAAEKAATPSKPAPPGPVAGRGAGAITGRSAGVTLSAGSGTA